MNIKSLHDHFTAFVLSPWTTVQLRNVYATVVRNEEIEEYYYCCRCITYVRCLSWM